MDAKKLDKFIERITKKKPKPVLVITARRIGKDRSLRTFQSCGLFGWWNGSELSFEFRPVRKKGKEVSVIMVRPFYWDEIVSIRIATQEDLINYANGFFGILEDVEEQKRNLANMRRW